eukprot:TRINITY_DN799_c0_g1_i6.p1 TRINITY_DN799_c0_g1~~TRINITY_DN799_c0_g1_i6.p1  ORF type:complete len:898 (+),score=300.51 TRINITY_DN799_c0_g1_i6:905-3598(+)
MMPANSMMGTPNSAMMANGPMMGQPGQMIPMVSHDGSGSSTPQQSAPALDWGIPPATRAKYASAFQQADRGRSGFLAGVPARNILLRSGLPQNVLAQIWALSDVDNDGKLSLEEFILSGYFCDQAQKGEPMPKVVPPNLVPPSLRKAKESASSGGTPVSVKSGAEDLASPTSFEDKRRENFNKGQAELERRRQSLIEEQKKDDEERKKKEKEEAEEKEKQKRELERQRLAEWEAQRKAELIQHRQREQEKVLFLKAKQDNLMQELEARREKVKTLTTGISDTRSGVTDVKTFIDGMRSSRDSKMADMNSLKVQLKDQNARLISVTQEKAKLDARSALTEAKIEEGRGEEISHFELLKQEKEKEVTVLREKLAGLKVTEEERKSKVEGVKQVLMELREKLKLIIEVCRNLFATFDNERREVKAEKAKRIRELTDPDAAWGSGFEAPSVVAAAIPPQSTAPDPLSSVKSQDYIKYRALYEYEARNDDELGFKVGDMLLVHPGQDHEPGWLGGELNGRVGWFPEAYAEKVTEGGLQPIAEEDSVSSSTNTLAPPIPAVSEGESNDSKSTARILHDWASTKESELNLVKGENISVTSTSNENWWQGESLEGKKGYFPSNFVTTEHLEARGNTPVEAPEVIGSSPEVVSAPEAVSGDEIRCVALYPYNSEEPGDLNFEQGDIIILVSQTEDWWTGRIGDRTGVFPFNYVEIIKDGEFKNVDAPQIPEAQKPSHDDSNDALPEASNDGSITEEASGKSPEIATVVAPYEASSKEQISLQKGQMILIKKKNSSGWWQGEVQGGKGKKRQIGWFPANYVTVVGGVSSGSEKTSSGATPGSEEAPKSEPQLKFKALFPYAANHEDELPFEADDVIILISKDEEAWWKGECKGLVGVFPSNYVELIE